MTQAIGGSTTPSTPTSSSIVQTANGAGTQSIGGLGTGLDDNAIVAALVAAERAQEDPIKTQADLANLSLQSYGLVRTDLASLSTAALALARPAAWQTLTATSSAPTVATVTAGSGSFGGTLSFTVDALASAGSVRSANVVNGTATNVTAATNLFVAAGANAIGFSTLGADNALALGAHTITVTQSSAAATKVGSNTLAASTVIDGTNDTLQLDVNGTPTTLTLAHGTYTAAQLAQAVQDATSVSAPLTATLDGSGTLTIATAREGSQATLQVTGGTALGALGLSTDAAAITGTDGVLTVDGGTAQTFSTIDPNQTLTLNAAAGTISAVVAGGLRTGSVTGRNVSLGDGSLASVVAAINNASSGVTATAVQVGSGAYRLQLTSNTAGAANAENVDTSVFNAAVGGFLQLSSASDARITIGSGPGAYTVTSATNTITGLLPGVTVNLVSQSASPVTVTVTHDENAIADKVQALVDAANKAKTTIDGLTHYDPNTKQASPLTGDMSATRVLDMLTNGFIGSVDSATPKSPGLAGVSIDKDGNFTFDRTKFTSAYEANPDGVTKLFTQGGTADNAAVQFVSAGDGAVAGSYHVVVTQAAAQGTDTGLQGAWPPAALPTVKVRVGSNLVSYAVKNTDTRADVAAGLNAAFANAKLNLQATDSGSGVEITTVDYGHSASFDVDWDGNGYVTHSGQDVQGTIGGVTATGSGQQLIVPFTDPTMGGLALRITGTTTGDLGNFTYQPGVAQRVQTAINTAADPITGFITAAESGLKSRVKFINDEVSQMELRVTQYEVRLRQQFSNLEATIGQLKSQSNWLASQIGSLPTTGSGK